MPPRSAVWIPGGALHSIKVTGALKGAAFVEPSADAVHRRGCCALSVTPLLRELLVRSATLPALYVERGSETRLMNVLLDELAAAEVADLNLPMPTDARLRKMADLMMAAPADRSSMHVWARRAGLSDRTLTRLIARETGMSFGRWRQQLSVMLAVKWLVGGARFSKSPPIWVMRTRRAL